MATTKSKYSYKGSVEVPKEDLVLPDYEFKELEHIEDDTPEQEEENLKQKRVEEAREKWRSIGEGFGNIATSIGEGIIAGSGGQIKDRTADINERDKEHKARLDKILETYQTRQEALRVRAEQIKKENANIDKYNSEGAYRKASYDANKAKDEYNSRFAKAQFEMQLEQFERQQEMEERKLRATIAANKSSTEAASAANDLKRRKEMKDECLAYAKILQEKKDGSPATLEADILLNSIITNAMYLGDTKMGRDGTLYLNNNLSWLFEGQDRVWKDGNGVEHKVSTTYGNSGGEVQPGAQYNKDAFFAVPDYTSKYILQPPTPSAQQQNRQTTQQQAENPNEFNPN